MIWQFRRSENLFPGRSVWRIEFNGALLALALSNAQTSHRWRELRSLYEQGILTSSAKERQSMSRQRTGEERGVSRGGVEKEGKRE